jgi:hypothetical protein
MLKTRIIDLKADNLDIPGLYIHNAFCQYPEKGCQIKLKSIK